MMMMMKLPILPCAEKLELVLSTAPWLIVFRNFAQLRRQSQVSWLKEDIRIAVVYCSRPTTGSVSESLLHT